MRLKPRSVSPERNTTPLPYYTSMEASTTPRGRAASQFVASSLWLEIGAQRRRYNKFDTAGARAVRRYSGSHNNIGATEGEIKQRSHLFASVSAGMGDARAHVAFLGSPPNLNPNPDLNLFFFLRKD